MCGILGSNGFFNKKEFIQALNLQKHRGPDDHGFYRYKKITLGHRRLKILDLTKSSSQPMESENKDKVIVYNGEIYNFKEIKKNLEDKGIKFNTTGDTEVLLKGYEYYGEKIFSQLIGMFSFAILCKSKNKIILARDRLGIKPLYYYFKDNQFIFSSEIKSILKLKKKYELNLSAVSSYLSFRYPIGEKTFFKDIYEVPPGNFMIFSKNQIKTKEYWSLKKFFQRKKKINFKKSKLELERSLKKSLDYRLISDVPVGAFLSGGLDSSILASMMAKSKSMSKKINTYTAGIKNHPNEFKYSMKVSKMYSLKLNKIEVNESQYAKKIKELIRFKDAPLGVPNEILIHEMSKQMKKKISVVISGEGADELFGGYGRIFIGDEDYKKLNKKNINYKLKKKLSNKYKNLKFKNNFQHFMYNYSYFSNELKNKIFKNKLKTNFIENELNRSLKKNFPISKKIKYFDAMTYFFIKVHLKGLLQRIDAMTMASSVEARVPFIDHKVVELAVMLPKRFKISNINRIDTKSDISDEISEKKDITKYILKETFKKILPKKIVERKKVGFPIFLEKLFNNQANIAKYKKQISKSTFCNRYLNIDFLLNILKNTKKNHKDSLLIWMIINLDNFYKIYFEKTNEKVL